MGKYAISCKCKDKDGNLTGPITNQSEKKRCDINEIDKRAKRIGYIDHVNQNRPMYGDFTEVPDYQQALNIKIRADQTFMALDPEIRKRFHNNPMEMTQFLMEESNYEEAVKMGMVHPEALERRKKARVDDELAKSGSDNNKAVQEGTGNTKKEKVEK